VFTALVASQPCAHYYQVVSNNGYFPTEPEPALNGAAQTALHESAAAATREQFGTNVFVRSVVEVSNFCRENYANCGMRRDNRGLARQPGDLFRLRAGAGETAIVGPKKHSETMDQP
jgi:hypothetical protein